MEFEQQQNVPEPPQNRPSKWVIGALILIIASYALGYQTGKKGFIYQPKEFKVVNQQNQPKTVDYQLLWDAINIVNDKYIDKPVDQQKILYGAVKGAVQATGDPYTDFFEPKDLQNFKTDLAGSFGGIGAEIGKKDGSIVIVAPLDGTPAQRAGLTAKDIITQVDGKLTADWSVEQAVSFIRGKPGTQVTLTIFRQGKDKPFDVKLTREKIEIKSVKWQFKDVGGKKIAVVTLSRFGDDTEGLFNQAVGDILKQNVSGIVLDLRNDPGGYLQTAVDVASNWVQAGKVVVTEAKSDGTSDPYNATGINRLGGIKTVALINGGSASAAEILAGALHDHGIVKLIGDKSFGKGSVQELVDLKDGSAVKVTVAKWITPNGKNLNKDGLDPDIPVKISDEDVAAGKDSQMDAAISEITNSK